MRSTFETANILMLLQKRNLIKEANLTEVFYQSTRPSLYANSKFSNLSGIRSALLGILAYYAPCAYLYVSRL